MLWGYCYIIVAADLTPSQKSVQGIHAAIESAKAGYLDHHENVVFCSLPDSQDLANFCSKLDQQEIAYKAFIEPDLDNKLTAVATKTVYGSERKIFKELKLV